MTTKIARKTKNTDTTPTELSAVTELRTWLHALDLPFKPGLHINGLPWSEAMLAVDFGQPIEPIRISTEEKEELIGKMRSATCALLGRQTVVDVQNDRNGIYWTAI